MRILLWLAPFCLALTACNMAISDHPMLSAEPRSALRLRDGLWALDDPECRFDVQRPAQQWPKCAVWFALRNNNVVDGPDRRPGEPDVELIIAAGEPPILELPDEDPKNKKESYSYLALEPAKVDSTGYLIALRTWVVACGVEGESSGLNHPSNIRHFEGMDEDCHPTSVKAIRAAAGAGPQAAKKLQWRWVRAAAN
jgi:hypothetical protein